MAGWLFVLPMVLGFVLLLLVPLIMALYMSFTDWPLLGEANFIGFENYRAIAGTRNFGGCWAIRFTLPPGLCR